MSIAREMLLSTFEKVSVFLKAPQVRLQKVKHSLGIPRIHPHSPQTDSAAFLLLYDAPPFGDKLLGAAKIVFGIHLSNNGQAAKQTLGHLRKRPAPSALRLRCCEARRIWRVERSLRALQ